MSLPGIKLVTFDVTNTLLKFRIPTYDYYALVARNHGFKGTGVDIKKRMLNSYRYLEKQYPNFGKNSICWNKWWSQIVEMTFYGYLPPNANINDISKQLIEDFKTSTCWEVSEGSVDLIKLLKSFEITVGVISNFDPRLHDILTNLNFNDCFKFILTSYEVGVSKPNKKIFEYAQAKYGSIISSQECLHIGDDIDKDYNGAKAAGWNALLVSDKEQKSPHSVNAYYNLKELYNAIANNKVQLP